MGTQFKKRIIVVNGPNLNMLGKREPSVYGSTTLTNIIDGLKAQGSNLGIGIEAFQSNSEGAIVEKIQNSMNLFHAMIINPAAYTHTSIAIRDAILLLEIPVIEVHLSNIYKRESFRHKSMIAGVVTGQISGFGKFGYTMALDAIANLLL